MRLHVQEFLDTHTLDDLTAMYAIKTKRHPMMPNLVHFKYDQINSPMHERIVQECRGLILDETNGWAVVARPFDKFFNYGEGSAAKINWKTARVQEKLDGSLLYIWNYAGNWHVSTSGRPAADGDINGKGTFSDLFWDTFHAQFPMIDPDKHLANHLTYIFELTAPENRVIVPHIDRRLTLIGVRESNVIGAEYPTTNWIDRGPGSLALNPVTEFSLNSIDAITESFGTFKPLEREGYVVVDGDYNRIKVKHPGYVALHHAKDSLGTSTRAIVELVRSGEAPEVLSYFPELKAAVDVEQARWDRLIEEITDTYMAFGHIESQKDFALAIKDVPWTAPVFAIRSGRCKNADVWLRQAPIDTVIRLMDACP